jgi:hypothetical protein
MEGLSQYSKMLLSLKYPSTPPPPRMPGCDVNLRPTLGWQARHGLINNTGTKAKCHHIKKLTCKWTLRPVFIIAY